MALDPMTQDASILSTTHESSMSPISPRMLAADEDFENVEPSFEEHLSEVNGNLAARELFERLQPVLEDHGYGDSKSVSAKLNKSGYQADYVGTEDPLIKIANILSDTLRALSHLSRRHHDTSGFLELTRTIAVLSRGDLWASAFTEFEVLNFYLDTLRWNTDTPDSWAEYGIRVIANCCTRSPQTKRKVFKRAPLGLLVQGLKYQERATLSAMAISAICSGVDEAIEQLERDHQLSSLLLIGIGSDFYETQHMDVLLELIETSIDYIDLSNFVESHVSILLMSAHKYNLSPANLCALSQLLLHLLDEEHICQSIVQSHLSLLLTFFLNTYTNEISDSLAVNALEIVRRREMPQQGANEPLDKSRKDIISKLEKLARVAKGLEGLQREISVLVSWLCGPERTIQIFACIFLGNVAFHMPTASSKLLANHHLAPSLSECIATGTEHDVLTSALDLLQNVATPANREMLGDNGLLESLMNRVVCLDVFSVRALFHIRQLINRCPRNAMTFLGGKDSIAEVNRDVKGTSIGQLLATFSNTEERNLLAEIGQVVAEIWRALYQRGPLAKQGDRAENQKSPKPDLPAMQDLHIHDFDSSPRDLGDPTDKTQSISQNRAATQRDQAKLVSRVFTELAQPSVLEPIIWLLNSENEALISSAWFILSLMAMCLEGATAIYVRCVENEDIFQTFQKTLQGTTGQAGAQNNALYLAAILREQLVNGQSRMCLALG